MVTKILLPLLALSSSLATPVPDSAHERDGCPEVHVFGARETGADTRFGLAGDFIEDIVKATGATAEPIHYPANGTANLTDKEYKASVQAGVKAVASQVANYAAKCSQTKLVLVGYSQGAKIFDDSLCGGGDPNMGVYDTSATIAQFNIKAVLLPADDRFTPGQPFHVGNATVGGFDQRPSGQTNCGKFNDAIQLYCDIDDAFCTNGKSIPVHNRYYKVYGQQALDFVKKKLSE